MQWCAARQRGAEKKEPSFRLRPPTTSDPEYLLAAKIHQNTNFKHAAAEDGCQVNLDFIGLLRFLEWTDRSRQYVK